MAPMGSPPVPPPPPVADVPPAPRRRRRWPWVLGGAALLLVLGAAGTLGYGLWLYANHDRPELVEDPTIIEVVLPACRTMTAAVQGAAVPTDAPTADRVASLRQQDRAVRAMVAAVEALGPERLAGDLPTPAWLADWQRLADAREAAADDLADGARTTWTVPTTEGQPITDRMDTVGLCPVPAELLPSP